MKCVEYEVNEGCVTLLSILETMYISEMIKMPDDIHNEIQKLYEMLVDHIERDYKDVDAKNIELVKSYFIKNKSVDRKFVQNVISICMRNNMVVLNEQSVYFTDENCDGYSDYNVV